MALLKGKFYEFLFVVITRTNSDYINPRYVYYFGSQKRQGH